MFVCNACVQWNMCRRLITGETLPLSLMNECYVYLDHLTGYANTPRVPTPTTHDIPLIYSDIQICDRVSAYAPAQRSGTRPLLGLLGLSVEHISTSLFFSGRAKQSPKHLHTLLSPQGPQNDHSGMHLAYFGANFAQFGPTPPFFRSDRA